MVDSENSSSLGLPEDPDRALQTLRTALEGVAEAIFLVRPDGREILACNPAAESLFGYTCGELLGQSTELLHVDREHFERFGQVSEEALEHEGAFRVEWKMRRKDGTIFPSTHVISLIDEDLGLGGGVVSIIRDRAAMDGAASQLRELERRYKVLFDENPEAMWVYDAESGVVLAVNQALVELYGGEASELVDHHVTELVADVDRKRLREILRRPEADRPRIGTWRVGRGDGTSRVLRTKSSAVTFDGRAARLVASVDITQRIEAESLAQRLLGVLEATPDFVGIAGKDERVEYVNPSGLRLVGREDMDLQDATIADFMTPESYALLQEKGIPTAVREGTWSGETRLLHLDGTAIPISQVVIHHPDEADGATYFSTIARDIREVQRLESQLRHAQKMEAIGRLAGGIAHDFNNILTTILGYAELTLEEPDVPEGARRHVREILTGARRAAELTTQLLTFSRRQSFETRVVDLDEIVREAAKMLRRTVEESVAIQTRLSEGGPRVDADPGQIHQVLLNLVVNARDAMPAGGTVRIETGLETLTESRTTDRGSLPTGDYAVLRVIDTGAGMDPHVLDRIFEPFFTTKEMGRGTGLGLSTVYGIVKQLDGFIEVESEPGAGSTFSVFLPRTTEEVVTRPHPKPSAPGPTRTASTILLTEDDDSIRRFVGQILETAGYRVLAAEDPAEALQRREDHGRPLDLLVTDMILPQTNGCELAERLRSIDPGLPVIFISGYSREIDPSRISTEGAVFLQKPFSPNALLATVERLVEPA